MQVYLQNFVFPKSTQTCHRVWNVMAKNVELPNSIHSRAQRETTRKCSLEGFSSVICREATWSNKLLRDLSSRCRNR